MIDPWREGVGGAGSDQGEKFQNQLWEGADKGFSVHCQQDQDVALTGQATTPYSPALSLSPLWS